MMANKKNFKKKMLRHHATTLLFCCCLLLLLFIVLCVCCFCDVLMLVPLLPLQDKPGLSGFILNIEKIVTIADNDNALFD